MWWRGGKEVTHLCRGKLSVCVGGGCQSVYLHECMCEHACGMCVKVTFWWEGGGQAVQVCACMCYLHESTCCL